MAAEIGSRYLIRRNGPLVAVPVEGSANHRLHAGIQSGGTAKVTPTLAGDCLRKVAGTAAAMHGFTLGGESESLLRPLVGLDFALAFALAHRSGLIRFSVNLCL